MPTTTTTTTTAVERYQPVLSDVEQSTLLGFLARYRGFTRDAYALDPRQFTAWCRQHDRRLFDVHRVDIECLARHLEDVGRARATVARRLCAIVGFYRYAEEEDVIEHSPAVHIRRPANRRRRSTTICWRGSHNSLPASGLRWCCTTSMICRSPR